MNALVMALIVFSVAMGSAQTPTGNLSSAGAQDAVNSAGQQHAVFDVVSIRPSKPGAQLDFGPTQNGYHARSTPLFWIIMDAYFPRGTAYWRADRMKSAPPWVSTEEYDIEAKVDPKTAREFAHLTDDQRDQQLKPMLHTMLTERCNLLIHQIATDGSIYALVVSRHGPRFNTVPLDTYQRCQGIPIAEGGSMLPIPVKDDTRHEFLFTHTSMTVLAEVLSGFSTRTNPPVEDHTGLSGTYDFLLFKDEDSNPLHSRPYLATEPEPVTLWDIGALGLELKRIDAPIPALVIAHIDRPTPN